MLLWNIILIFSAISHTVESSVDGVQTSLRRRNEHDEDTNELYHNQSKRFLDTTFDFKIIRKPKKDKFRCTCHSCNRMALRANANGHTCGDRIDFLLQSNPNIYSTEEDACIHVANIEYPDECGSCDPLTCDDRTVSEPSYYCGCNTCTPEIFRAKTQDADAYVSCGARIKWLIAHQQLSEREACNVVSQQFPNICGPSCDPQVCNSLEQPSINLPSDPPLQFEAPFPTVPVPVTNKNFHFGPNVVIIDSSMTTSEIQGIFDDIYNTKQQVNDEMGTNRFSILFEPGVYGSTAQPLMIQLGYYTEVSGLGANPNDVQIYGKIEVYNRCFLPDSYQRGKFVPAEGGNGNLCFALNNFWRSLSNLSIHIVSHNQDPCRSRAMFWATSQASSMRRVDISGGEVSLMDYCTEPGYSSGGFISDTKAEKVFCGSQQQFFSRNMDISYWDGGIWNQVFMGVRGAPDDSSYPDPPFTTFDKVPLSREKPYLYIKNGHYFVHVPSIAVHTTGVTWANNQLTPGRSYPISKFFVPDTTSTVSEINDQLAAGKNLIFTPGVYEIDDTIFVGNPYTVILGLGHATLTALNGVTPLKLADQPGIIVAGLILDAGTVKSDVLLQVGPRGIPGNGGGRNNPTTLSDVYFRVGGPHVGRTDICLEINSDNVLIDHTWIWRADHGIENFDINDGFDGDNERWTTNIGRNGLVVNGHNVTATGLFVEHFQQYNVLWNGQGGKVYFFQNELPYDPPTQADWTTPDGTFGWSGYKVNDTVTSHEFWSGGVYSYNRNNPSIVTTNGFEVPNHTGVKMNKMYTRNLSGPGIISSVINGVGKQVDSQYKGPSYVVKYRQDEL